MSGIDPAAALEVAALEHLGLEALRQAWRSRYGRPPSLRSPELLRLMLAWRIQAQLEGGLSADVRRSLRRTSAYASATATAAAPGALVVREWHGVRHEAVALEDGGFLYEGTRYKSLSEIARRITGSRWNGPRFFGLRATGP